jgi:hypothetical protein
MLTVIMLMVLRQRGAGDRSGASERRNAGNSHRKNILF